MDNEEIKKYIDNIVWWIPFKKLRNFIRILLNNIVNINNLNNVTNINTNNTTNNNITNINNNININYSNLENINISKTDNIYEYDYFFSIGENCFTGEILDKLNLRKKSSPFDWLTPLNYSEQNIYNVLNIINRRFSDFFNKEDLINYSHIYPHEINDVYFNTRNLLFFPHDFYRGNDFSSEYPELYNKYKRRSDNFINQLESGNKILMVYIEYYKLKNSNIDICDIINNITYIRNNYKNNNIDLLYIKHDFYLDDKIYFKNIDNRLHLYILDNSFDHSKKYNEEHYNDEWIGNIESISKIFSRYKLKV